MPLRLLVRSVARAPHLAGAVLLPCAYADRSAADLDGYQGMQPKPEGEIEFAALMRKLDRADSSYRH